MSEAIRKQYGNVEVNLVKSSGGVFEIYKDDKLVFSKKSLNRFPQAEEVLNALK